MLSDDYISVTDLNSYLKTYLEGNYFLQDLYVKGEISNFKRHQSGTLYFAIKDEKSRVAVVMFPFYASRNKYSLKDGDMVLIKGKLSVFEANGSYSIQANEILFDSIGMLYIRYEELKKKLELEGLFDTVHKKRIPSFPKRIGIITASSGAAIHDMLKTIYSRWPIADVILFPSLVQGKDAAIDIARNIKLADEYKDVDVIICGRGGGSIEDLWPFNEEIVARAIYNCKTPIISAVGHQSDYTIADFVADVRGLTPTDGAIQATPNIIEVKNHIINLKENLKQSLLHFLQVKRQNLNRYQTSYLLQNPKKIYENYRMTLDHFEITLNNSILNYTNKEKVSIQSCKESLKYEMVQYLNGKRNFTSNIITKLDAISPLKVLKRGYSFVTKDHITLKSIQNVEKNDNILINLSDGVIHSKVISKEINHGNRKN